MEWKAVRQSQWRLERSQDGGEGKGGIRRPDVAAEFLRRVQATDRVSEADPRWQIDAEAGKGAVTQVQIYILQGSFFL